jgi:Fe-S cluster biogenesis protein NfuA
MMTIEQLDEKLNLIRPFLAEDDGNVEVVEITKEMDVIIRLLGSCSLCTKKENTIKLGIENVLKQFFPEIRTVIEL